MTTNHAAWHAAAVGDPVPDWVAFRPAERIVGAVFVAPWCGARFLVLGGGRRPIAGIRPRLLESFLTVQALDAGDGADRWPLHPSELRRRASRLRGMDATLAALEDAADADRRRWGRCSPYNGNGREYAARELREAGFVRRAAVKSRRVRGRLECAREARGLVAAAVCARRNVATWPVLP